MLVTTYHGASADNHQYWPEIYTNFSIVDGQPTYGDSQNPLRNATSFDPQLFADIDPYAEALLSGSEYSLDKYFPIEFCQWVEDFAAAAATNLTAAEGSVTNRNDPVFRRLDIDVQIQSKMGVFFGKKFRAAVLWSIYRKTNDANAKTEAINLYNAAKQAWTDLATLGGVYLSNITYGSTSGHWADRTAAITNDINAMVNTTYSTVTSITTHPGPAAAAIATVTGRPSRPAAAATHNPPGIFAPGAALNLSVNVDASTTAAKLYYRHVNQAEKWQSVDMTKSGNSFQASIPAAYTQTVYALQYYFGLTKGNTGALLPGFDSTLANQPYYVVRSVAPTSEKFSNHNGANAIAAVSNIAVFQRGRTVVVEYSLNRTVPVSARLFNCNGKLIASSADFHNSVGRKVINFSLKMGSISSGEYILEIVAGESRISKTVMISK